MNRYYFDYTILDNGVKVLSYPKKDVNGAGLEIEVAAGSIDENTQTNGIFHALEHMVYRGTRDFPSREDIVSYENTHALNINSAHTTDIYTLFEGYGIYTDLEKLIHILSQMILHPQLLAKDWEIEKNIILDEIQRRSDKPWYQLFSLVNAKRYRPGFYYLGHDVTGAPSTVQRFDIADLQSAHNLFYHPENIRIAVAGNIEIDQVHKWINQYFPRPKDPNIADYSHRIESATHDIYSDFSIHTLYRKENRVYLTFSFPGLTMRDEVRKRMASTLLSAMLTSRQDSLLWKMLRENLGIVYDISSSNFIEKYYGVFTIQCDFHPDYLDRVISEIFNAIDAFKTGQFDSAMLENEINIRNKRSLLTFDEIEGAINWLVRELNEEKIMLPEDYIHIRSLITTTDIIQIAHQVFDWKKANIALLGPVPQEQFEAVIYKYLPQE